MLLCLDLELVLGFLALGQVQVQHLEPWLQLKPPSMEQEVQGHLGEWVSQVVWQELDLLPQLLLPKLLPKLPSMASVALEPEGSGLEDLGQVELPQALEVCPLLYLLRQPNMVPLVLEASSEPGPSRVQELQQDLALDCLPFSQVVEPGAWDMVANHQSPMEGP